MNGAHDVGGMHGFGPVTAEVDEPVFHEEWERHVAAVLIGALAQGVAVTDENRNAIENMGNVRYHSTSYYEHWLVAMETLLVQKGVIGEEDRRERVRALMAGEEISAPDTASDDGELARTILEILAKGGPTVRETGQKPRFAIGDEVVATDRVVRIHTRVPGYVRGKRGTIVAHHGSHVLPETNAYLLGENPEPLYSVRFDARELWGEEAEADGQAVHVDLWESHLAPYASGAESEEK